MYELKRMALGEFMDDIDIGKQINEVLGIPPSEESSTDEKVGEERLGSSNILESFGATLIACSIVFAAIVLLIVIVVFIARRVTLS